MKFSSLAFLHILRNPEFPMPIQFLESSNVANSTSDVNPKFFLHEESISSSILPFPTELKVIAFIDIK